MRNNGVSMNKDGVSMSDRDSADAEQKAILSQWSADLVAALKLDGLEVDIDDVLGLAGLAARSVVRPAAPLTTFLVGYAAGLLAAEGSLRANDAFAQAAAVARSLAAARRPSDPA
jgi:Domain of unknown function (DUF6457)